MSWLDCSNCHVILEKSKNIEHINEVLLGTNIKNSARNYSISQSVGNNKILSRTKIIRGINIKDQYASVMPAKFQSADSGGQFSIGRLVFKKNTNLNLYTPQKKKGKLLGLDGQDRSSSSYMERRKAIAIGKGSYSENIEKLAYAKININDSNRARNRVRAGGSISPAKKGSIRHSARC